MKVLKPIGLLLCIFIINNCTQKVEPNEITEGTLDGVGAANNYYTHTLFLSFQDASGNDLVKGIESEEFMYVKSELYTLKIDCKEIQYQWKVDLNTNIKMYLWFGDYLERNCPNDTINSNYDYLRFKFTSTTTKRLDVPFPEKITFLLKCPYLFGDDAEHEIVTLWKPNHENIQQLGRTACYRIEYGGNEFTDIKYAFYDSFSIATIVLDR